MAATREQGAQAEPARFVARSPLAPRAFFRDPVSYVCEHAGEAAVVHVGTGPANRLVLVRDPEAVWDVLVRDAESFRPGRSKRRARRLLGRTLSTLDGEEHRRRRTLLAPALGGSRIALFVPAIVARAERAQDVWYDGATLILRDSLDPLSLTVAGDVLLSADLDPVAPELAAALGRVMRAVPLLRPPLRWTAGRRALSRVDRLVQTLVADRRDGLYAAPQNDLLGTLLRSDLPPATIRGEVIAFLLAAVDEPPSALEAAWYLLGTHPDAEARLHEELDDVLGGRTPTLADRERLPYLNAVLRETLRLFPPAHHIDRCPVRKVDLGAMRVGRRANVLVSPLVTHRDPRVHDRPMDFRPERWLEPGSWNGSRGAYIPFGAGPHACIGEPLATAIVTFTLAVLAGRWRLRVDPRAEPPVPRSPRLRVRLERRP